MAKKEDLYTNNPTYSRPLPKNFSSKASDMAKALFGLRLTLEEKKGSTELVKFMNCQVHLQGDNVRHATAVCMGQANPEQFAQITVTRCGQSSCGVPYKFVTLNATSADRIILFQQFVDWLTRCKAFKKLEALKKIAPHIAKDKVVDCRRILRQIEDVIDSQRRLKSRSKHHQSSPAPASYPRDNREIKSSPVKRKRSWSLIEITDDEHPPKKCSIVHLSDEDEVVLVDTTPGPRRSKKGKERAVEPDGKVIIIGDEVIVADADPTVPSSPRISGVVYISSDDEEEGLLH
ncbi:hypothetical protein BT96DRAFT_944954 [Gymnopus androsaceus JB14]|uniref:Uncharacterized protein n=1 Tax=Gymnopus androsaceus JB14 TaxID=1447944 RepID=A0A6A4H1H5_9AGAR|nr:hypothetical protein BT96DRAFT_944954 [Gymnopus androsaceus JB14]